MCGEAEFEQGRLNGDGMIAASLPLGCPGLSTGHDLFGWYELAEATDVEYGGPFCASIEGDGVGLKGLILLAASGYSVLFVTTRLAQSLHVPKLRHRFIIKKHLIAQSSRKFFKVQMGQLFYCSSVEWVIYQFELMEANKVVIKGYLYIIVQKFDVPDHAGELTCNISLGIVAKCNTQPSLSGKVINEVFLMEVPEEPSRLVFELRNSEGVVGDCRYDVNPFFSHPGAAHTISSDLFDNSQQIKGTITTKITYYSAEHGKLKLRVFHLSLLESLTQKYKTARLKTKIGIYAQTSPEWKMDSEFDHTFELLILLKNGNLEFDVMCSQGILGKYQIYDLEKSGLMVDKPKAYQVSLFNGENAVGTIKYQVDWQPQKH